VNTAGLLCHRCGATLTPGKGSFYVVRIEAFADPTAQEITAEDLLHDPGAEIDQLIEAARETSAAELMDQVYRKMTIHLCWPCYRRWIEDPAGSGGR
jgi:hypothetical protein